MCTTVLLEQKHFDRPSCDFSDQVKAVICMIMNVVLNVQR